jgi:iron complex transport system substrate-binding protein
MPEDLRPTTRTPAFALRPARSAIAAVTLVLALTGAACSSGSEAAADKDGSDPAAADAWTYTDDTGATVTLDEAPDTIVAETTVAGGLWELGITADATFGPLTRSDGTSDASIGLADPADFASVGEAYGQINLEQLAALEPDVIIAPVWEDDTYWGIEDDMIEQVRQIAPIIGIDVSSRPIDEVLDEVATLAVALGADADSAEVTDAKAAFTEASEQLSAAAAADPDLRVLVASGTPEQLYVAVPAAYPDLSYYQSLGLGIIDPDTDDEFWHTLSWEQADLYPADMIMADARGGTPEQVIQQMPPNAQQLPAVTAGQLVTWQVPTALGYEFVAGTISQLATEVQQARSGLS